MVKDWSPIYVAFWIVCGFLMLGTLVWIGRALARIAERLERIARALEAEGRARGGQDRPDREAGVAGEKGLRR